MLDIIINDLPSYAKFISYQKQNPFIDIKIKNIHLTNTDITIIQLPNVVEIIEDFIIENNYELKIITNTNKLKNIGGHFRIVDNWYLRSINGFENLQNILFNQNKITSLGCETSDFFTSCKRGFVIKNNWNLENLPKFTNLNVPDDKVGDEEYFLIMNNPNYNIKEITETNRKRNLWEILKFKIDSLNNIQDFLTTDDPLSDLDNVPSIDNIDDNIKSADTIVSPKQFNENELDYRNDDIIAFYIQNEINNFFKPFFLSFISQINKPNDNELEIKFNPSFETYLARFDSTIYNKIKLVRLNDLKYNPDLFIFNPINICSIDSCFLPTFTTYKKFIENNEEYQTNIVQQNKDIYFSFGNVHTLEHFFKFSQFCLAENFFNNKIILDGSLSISNLIEINGIPNLKKITGNFYIFNNPNLTSLKNFNNLEEVSGNFILYNNPNLNFIGNFSKLANNTSLSNLSHKILVKNSGTKTITNKYKLINFLIKNQNNNLKKPINFQNILSIFISIFIIIIIIYLLIFNNYNK